MNQFFYQITRKASELINSDDYRERNITKQTAFSRNRKLTFPVMIVLLLNFLTRTMQIELDDFFANVLNADTNSVTKQAFFKARKNILPDAFKELFLMTRDMVLNKNKIAVLQEYYAMMFVLNCIAAMSATVNRKLLSKKADCKYQYRANVNLMIGYFKYRLSAMLLFAENALDICRQLILLCLKQPVPVINGRSAPRPVFSHQRKVFCPKYSI